MPVDTPAPADDSLDMGGLRILPGDRLGPYVYRRLVGKGGMANVLLAADPDGRQVALKVLKANRMGSGLSRFKREFRALARLRHPNVIRVEAYGDLYGHPYIAMEYVEGTDLHNTIHAFRGWRPAERWRRCEEILVDLCRALAYIHRRGLIHRDLKPSNVLIDNDRRCKLTDFGIVKDLDPETDTLISTTLVGTWAYASPEQMQGTAIDHRSDLYSLGVMLFAMLTGRRPFVAKDLSGYLELHRTHEAPRPRAIDPGVPAHLDEICERLLRKQPRERFRSAQEILYRLEQEDAFPEVEAQGAWKPPLVGRREEEEVLREKIAGLTSGRGGVVFVEGGEGSGKSRVLDVAEAHAMLLGLPVLRSRVEARDGALGPLIRLAHLVRGELGPGRAPPGLDAALGSFAVDAETVPGNARERLVDALGASLAAMVDEGPLVVLVDDLHRARIPMLEALFALHRRLGSLAVLFVYALTSDRSTPRLDALRAGAELADPPVRIPLPPLDAAAIEQLVDGLIGAGKPAAVLAERLHRETQGSPLFVTLFLQQLMSQGVLVRSRPEGTGSRERAAWRLVLDVEEVAGGHFEIPPGVRQVVRARLAPLTDAERQVVEALAVHGPQMAIDTLLEVLEVDEDEASDRIDALEDAGIIQARRVGEEVSLDFTHSKFGDVTYRELPLEARSLLHRRMAAALESRHANHVAAADIVGEHYRRAGEAGKAWLYLISAAEKMRDRSLAGEAKELTERALALQDAARMEVAAPEFASARQRLLQVEADLHIIAGEWAEARDAVEQAVGLGPDEADVPTLRARITLTRIQRATGALEAAEAEALEALVSARQIADIELLCEALRVRAAVAWSRGDLDTADASGREGLSHAHGPGLTAVRAHLLLARASLLFARGQLPATLTTVEEALTLLRELHLKPFFAVGLAMRAEVAVVQGRLGDAWRDGVLALQHARESTSRYAETLARLALGGAALEAGHLGDAMSDLEVAHVRSRGLRLSADVALPALRLARARLARGDLAPALSLLDESGQALTGGDPERLQPRVLAVRARVLARGPDAVRASPLLAAGSAGLGSLPPVRASQVAVDLALCAERLDRPAEALALAKEALSGARMRGARLVQLEALGVLSRVSPELAARRTFSEARAALHGELAADLPERWRAPFVTRGVAGP